MKNTKPDSYHAALMEMSKKSPDTQLALSLLNSSLEKGNSYAAYALGTWYLYGENVEQDLVKAVKLFKQAANGKISDAFFDLAVCYERGEGTRKLLKLAAENYLRAAQFAQLIDALPVRLTWVVIHTALLHPLFFCSQNSRVLQK